MYLQKSKHQKPKTKFVAEHNVIHNKRNTQSGITLVALIITIIVLLILATVSIALVMNSGIIDRADESVKTYSAEEIGEQLKLAYSEYQAAQYSEGANDATAFVKARLLTTYGDKLDQSSVKVENGKVTAKINGKTYEYDTATGTAGENKTKAYVVGDVVTLGGEQFYVIEVSDASTPTVKLLAKYNVQTTSGERQYTQSASANTLRFDDNSNDYATSEIKIHVDAYKTALEGRIGKTTQGVRLMTKEEVEALGGKAYGSLSGCPGFIQEQRYWLGTPNSGYANFEWRVSSNFNDCRVNIDDSFGLRPVVVILKSNI